MVAVHSKANIMAIFILSMLPPLVQRQMKTSIKAAMQFSRSILPFQRYVAIAATNATHTNGRTDDMKKSGKSIHGEPWSAADAATDPAMTLLIIS